MSLIGPGFSSRSQTSTTRQFPQRDEAGMTQDAGWSNSAHVPEAPESVYPDVQIPEVPEPGFSNDKAVAVEKGEVDVTVDDEPADDDKSTAKPSKGKG